MADELMIRTCPRCGVPSVRSRETQVCGLCQVALQEARDTGGRADFYGTPRWLSGSTPGSAPPTAAPTPVYYCETCGGGMAGATEGGVCVFCTNHAVLRDARGTPGFAEEVAPTPRGLSQVLQAPDAPEYQNVYYYDAGPTGEIPAALADRHVEVDRPAEEEEDEEASATRRCERCTVDLPGDREDTHCSGCRAIMRMALGGFASEDVGIDAMMVTAEAQNVVEDEESPPLCNRCSQRLADDHGDTCCGPCRTLITAEEEAAEDEEAAADEEEAANHVDNPILVATCERCSGSFAILDAGMRICSSCAHAIADTPPHGPAHVDVASPPATEVRLDTMSNVPQSYLRGWELEGWSIFEANGLLEIEKDYSQNIFNSDADAVDYVVMRAMTGSKPHILALWFHGQPPIVSHALATVIPPQLLEQSGDTQPVRTVHAAGSSSVEHITVDLSLPGSRDTAGF